MKITFTEVYQEGLTTLATSSSGPAPPTGFVVAGVYYELETTAGFYDAKVCFQFLPTERGGDCPLGR